ncbi:MAG: hypothetical protein ACLPUO_03700 [Streptosporangiaceae bacterium]|jgi:hypothetical protein
MTTQQLDLPAVVGLAVGWGAFLLTWLAGAIYNDSRAPKAERARTWFGSTGWVIVGVARTVAPRAAWNSLALPSPPWIRILGLAILLAATALTVRARLALGTMLSGLLLSFAVVEDAGWDAVLLAEGEEPAAVDQVEWLASGELVPVRSVARGGDHASLDGALVPDARRCSRPPRRPSGE